jgi:hypothetical protein
MLSTNMHARAMQRAAQAMGSVEALRAHLQVSMAELCAWMTGEARPPDAVFLKVVDLLADEQLARIRQGLRDPDPASGLS